jgi:hypothetical protein
MPSAGEGSLAKVNLLQQERHVMNGPTMDSGVIDGGAALGHHLFQLPRLRS